MSLHVGMGLSDLRYAPALYLGGAFVHSLEREAKAHGCSTSCDHRGRMEWIGIWTKQASSHLSAKSPKGQMLTLLTAMFWNILSQVSFLIQRMM